MAELLTAEQVGQGLAALEEWRHEGDLLVSSGQYPDFSAALRRLNAVAEIAECENHHPDLELHGWNKLTIRLTTHSAGGITEADLAMAHAISALQ